MDNVVTSILVMSGDGTVQDHVGGYGSWVEKGGRLAGLDDAPRGAGQRVKQPRGKPKPAAQTPKPAKLSYMDQRELDSLPGRIEELEEKKARIEEQVADPGFYRQEQSVVRPILDDLAGIVKELETAYERWAELDG